MPEAMMRIINRNYYLKAYNCLKNYLKCQLDVNVNMILDPENYVSQREEMERFEFRYQQ